MARRIPMAFLMTCLAAAAARHAASQDVRVNDVYSSDEGLASIATYGQGFAASWASQEFCTYSISARVFDLGGAFKTADFPAEPCNSAAFYSAVGGLPGGPLLVAYIVGDVYAEILDTAGNPLTPEFQVNTTPGSFVDPQVVGHPAGYFVVGYTTNYPPGGNFYARLVMPDGTMPAPDVTLPQRPLPATVRASGRLAVFANGDVVAGWADEDASTYHTVWTRLFNASLTALGGDIQVNQAVIRASAQAIGLAAGTNDYVVAWHQGILDYDVMGRVLSRSGPLGDEFMVNTFTADSEQEPVCAMDASDRGLVLWRSHIQDGSTWGAYGQRLDASGNKLGTEFRVNMTTYAAQGDPAIAMLPSGSFAVAFGSRTDPSQASDVLFRRFFFPVSLALGPGPGSMNAPWLVTKRTDGSPAWPRFYAFGASGYGTTAGAGDIDADGISEILAGPGPSPVYGPQVRAFRRDGTAIAKVNFYAYGTLRYGVKEGGANVDGDPYSEILTTPGPGAVFGPHVRGWSYDNATLTPIQKISFFAFNTLKYGCNASRGNVDGDAYDEILAAAGPSAAFSPHVRGFNYDNSSVTAIAKVDFNAFTWPPTYGATLSAADIESDGIGGYGDGFDELVVGRGPDPAASADFRVFDYDGASIAQKWEQLAVYGSRYGINIAGGDVDAGDTEEIATGPGPDPTAPARVLCFEWNPLLGYNPLGATLQTIGTDDFTAFSSPSQLLYGVNVAVGTFE